MDARLALDTVIQSASVELFASYGVAIAPLPRASAAAQAARFPDFPASVSFKGSGFAGVLTLAAPGSVLVLMEKDPSKVVQARDWIRELTNQLMGRLKNRLMQFQVTLVTGLPDVSNREVLERQRKGSDTMRFYLFRTLRGDVAVSLEGTLNESALRYTGAVKLAGEGDIILF